MPCSHCHQSGHNITTCKLVGLQVGGGPTQRSITADEMTRVSSCVKIQRAWRAFKPEHTCSICLSGIDKEKNCCVTECGHKFCFKCLATSLQHRQTCPLCRATLVPEVNNDDEDIIESYQNGLDDGRQNTMAYARQLVEEREEIAYGRGLIDGRAITEDELDIQKNYSRAAAASAAAAHASAASHVVALDMAKAEITRLKFQVDNLRLDHRSMVANMQLDLIHHQNLIRDLKTENSCISMNLRKRLKDVCDIPHTE